VLGIAGRRFGLTVAMAVMTTGAVATTEALKRFWALGSSDGLEVNVEPSTFPSAHSTAAMTLAVGAVLVGPHRARGYVAVAAGALASGQAFGMLSQSWHFPSDVLAGYLVVAGWTGLTLAFLHAVRQWRSRASDAPEAPRPALEPVAVPAALAAILALVGLVAAVDPSDALSYARDHTAGAAAATIVALTTMAIPLGAAAALPGPPRRVR
jgi:hypothetical protein